MREKGGDREKMRSSNGVGKNFEGQLSRREVTKD